MNKILKLFLPVAVVAFLLLVSGLYPGYTAFEDIGVGARPLGMGNAFCGIVDDVNAFLYNPSGLTQLERMQVSAMYASLYPGLSDGSGIVNNFIAIAYPSMMGTIGFSWFNLNVNSDPERAKATYTENTYILSYARYLEFISTGISLRFHSKEYGESYWTGINPAFASGRSAFGIGIDLSALYKTRDQRLSIGLMLSDINQPDLHLETGSPVPVTLRAGAGYKILSVWTFEDIVADLDFTLRDGDIKFHTGIEGWIGDKTIGLRCGFGFGTNYFSSFSIGASYHLVEEVYNNDFRLDYAFLYPLSGMQPTGGTHRISLTMGFGGM